MNAARVIFLLAIASAISGCASGAPAEPEHIELEYVGGGKPLSDTEELPCIWIDDRRSRDAFYGARVSSDKALAWMSAGIENRLHATTRTTDTIPERGLLISLLKAYINPNDITLSGVVSIKVTWGERETVYRGQVVQTNWWGAESEIGRTMSAALDKALLKINFPITTSTCSHP